MFVDILARCLGSSVRHDDGGDFRGKGARVGKTIVRNFNGAKSDQQDTR